MKIKHALSLASLALCAAMSTSASAQNVVNFEGYVVETLCTATAGVGGLVTLVNVEKDALVTLGTLGTTEFPVALKDCDPTDSTYQVNFSSGTAVNGRLPNTDATGAKNVSLQLLSSTDNELVVTATPAGKVDAAIDPGIAVTGSAGIGTGTYKVRYYAETGGVTVGKVTASATMTLNFL